MDENEKEIQEIDFIMAFAENDGFIRKQRIEWKDGDVKWFLDSVGAAPSPDHSDSPSPLELPFGGFAYQTLYRVRRTLPIVR